MRTHWAAIAAERFTGRGEADGWQFPQIAVLQGMIAAARERRGLSEPDGSVPMWVLLRQQKAHNEAELRRITEGAQDG